MTPSRPTGKHRRHTPQRQVILEELCELRTHPTAAELYALVRDRLPRISLGTVYRNLEVLCADGLARKLTLAGSDARYDGVVHRHDHVRCTGCGILRDLPRGALQVSPVAPAEAAGFRIEGYRLEFQGLCPSCRTGADPGAEDRAD
ncbi:MAG: transcriptional repressor [Krumholzibacteria bacterium]|nr:transcriptional repressor [Candidatus Krumholzibacteria bacterium]